jgi:hypothetical protein
MPYAARCFAAMGITMAAFWRLMAFPKKLGNHISSIWFVVHGSDVAVSV